MPVIAALEFHDFVASGESPRQTQAGHRRLGAAVDHADFSHRGHPRADQLRHFHFERIRNAIAQSASRRRAHRIDHDARGVTEDGRTPSADVVDVFVPVDIPDPCSFRAIHKERLTPDPAESAHRRIDAARNAGTRRGEEFVRARTRGHFFWWRAQSVRRKLTMSSTVGLLAVRT